MLVEGRYKDIGTTMLKSLVKLTEVGTTQCASVEADAESGNAKQHVYSVLDGISFRALPDQFYVTGTDADAKVEVAPVYESM